VPSRVAGEETNGFAALYRRLDQAERALSRDAGASPERRREVLAARARALAAARQEPTAGGEDMVAFSLCGERFGLPTALVSQVLDLRDLSPLPGAPQLLAGMIAARSRVVPVVDPRPVLGLSHGGLSDLAVALVVEGPRGLIALAAERVEGRVEAAAGGSAPPGPGPFLRIAPDGLVILDVDRLVAAISRGA
jgi:purine-binding chemotaxis protein CheW